MKGVAHEQEKGQQLGTGYMIWGGEGAASGQE